MSATSIVGIVGGIDQVRDSLSPAIHNAAFEALAMDWAYLRFGMDGDVGPVVRGLLESGVRGLNVTLPHKVRVIAALDELADSARAAGSVNTIASSAGRLVGHNTDGDGLLRFIERDLGREPSGARWLILGAGGAARGVVAAAARAKARSIRVLARDRIKAQELSAICPGVPFTADDMSGAHIQDETDLVINATPLGQRGEMPPILLEGLTSQMVIIDLVYKPPVTPLMKAAREAGAIAHSGLGMLLHQAAIAFEIWTGTPAPMNPMSAAAVARSND